MKNIYLLLTLLCSLQLFACSGPNIELEIASHRNINPDHSGRPSPVKMKVFELRNNINFEHADFTTLFTNPIQVLGADLLATDEFILIPGETRIIKYMPNLATKYIGVIAGFRQLDRATWRIIHPVIADKKNPVGLEISDTSVLLIVGHFLKDWSPEIAVQSYNPTMSQQNSSDKANQHAAPLGQTNNAQSPSSKMILMSTPAETNTNTVDSNVPPTPTEPFISQPRTLSPASSSPSPSGTPSVIPPTAPQTNFIDSPINPNGSIRKNNQLPPDSLGKDEKAQANDIPINQSPTNKLPMEQIITTNKNAPQ